MSRTRETLAEWTQRADARSAEYSAMADAAEMSATDDGDVCESCEHYRTAYACGADAKCMNCSDD